MRQELLTVVKVYLAQSPALCLAGNLEHDRECSRAILIIALWNLQKPKHLLRRGCNTSADVDSHLSHFPGQRSQTRLSPEPHALILRPLARCMLLSGQAVSTAVNMLFVMPDSTHPSAWDQVLALLQTPTFH